MYKVTDDSLAPDLCTPPPLSPTKSISSCDWSSPPTPESPRKVRSCLLFQTADFEGLALTPPTLPVKFDSPAILEASSPKQAPGRNPTANLTLSSVTSLTRDGLSDATKRPFQSSGHITRLNGRPAPIPATCSEHDTTTTSAHIATSLMLTPPPTTSGHQDDFRILTDHIESEEDTHSLEPGFLYASSRGPIIPPTSPTTSQDGRSQPNSLNRLPLRCSSSPLRPSQWVTRGGLLSSTRHHAWTPDRFISSRRPPYITRESFELSKPSDRLVYADKTPHRNNARVDPFSRLLHRSNRMNDELRSLRETYSVMPGQAQSNRRGTNLSLRRNSLTLSPRQASAGAVWNVGGTSAASGTVVGVPNGRGGLLGRGTNAPLYTSMFLNKSDPDAEIEAYERRLALAFDLNQADRVLGHSTSPTLQPSPSDLTKYSVNRHVWKDNAWTKEYHSTQSRSPRSIKRKPVPILPFRVLDAPQLRDDYYCSLLAYSHTARCLAVGLGNVVHLWSERTGVNTPESLNATVSSDVQHITSLDFSSAQGAQAILAVGRADGRLSLWSPFDKDVRFTAEQPKPISCVSFRPSVVKRPSRRDPAITVATEELLIGDEIGHIYFYSVEWPGEIESALFAWNGSLSLLARMNFHSQQICGLSWSADGELFASGGNDNACYLLETRKVLRNVPNSPLPPLNFRQGPNGETVWTLATGSSDMQSVEAGEEKHRWDLNAAVKAIAFCPWQRGLIAIGGGSNDRCIHFFHTISGACLSTIDCAAQITSLVWSTSRKEIAATFGFAQPEHPYRVAVFAWPSCEQIVAIPWYDENRALYAIPYPGSSNAGKERGDDGLRADRTAEEGCIVVAASDAAVRFHEIWSEDRRKLGNGVGLLGGSEILEHLHGIERDDEPGIR